MMSRVSKWDFERNEKVKQSKIFFNQNVKKQLLYLKHPLHKYQKLKRYLHAIEISKITKNDKVLDIGCGIGYQVPTITRRCKKYFGLDFSENAINVCQRNNKKFNSKFVCSDAHVLPFKNNFFDVILIIDTLENLFSPEKCLKEAYRILKKNGRIVVSVPNISSFYGLGKNYIKKNLANEVPPIQKWFDKKSITKLLERNGFDIVDIRSSFFLPPFFTGKYYIIPPMKKVPEIYNPFENILSKHMKSFGYHVIVCGMKK